MGCAVDHDGRDGAASVKISAALLFADSGRQPVVHTSNASFVISAIQSSQTDVMSTHPCDGIAETHISHGCQLSNDIRWAAVEQATSVQPAHSDSALGQIRLWSSARTMVAAGQKIAAATPTGAAAHASHHTRLVPSEREGPGRALGPDSSWAHHADTASSSPAQSRLAAASAIPLTAVSTDALASISRCIAGWSKPGSCKSCQYGAANRQSETPGARSHRAQRHKVLIQAPRLLDRSHALSCSPSMVRIPVVKALGVNELVVTKSPREALTPFNLSTSLNLATSSSGTL